MATIVIDAGHGGFDNGAMYMGRKEKDDNLRLALAVGKLLEQKGYDVVYTRTTDVYQSPYEKAQIANDARADYFVSFHRNSGEVDNSYNGVQTLIYGGDERAERLAQSINEELEKTGFNNLGIDERTGLVVLRRTEMPAVLIEAGFINHDKDNAIFDEKFPEVAQAIATGIERAVPLSGAANRTMDMREESDWEMENRARGDNREMDDRTRRDGWEMENRARETNREMDDRSRESKGNLPASVYGVEVGRFLYETTANFMAEQLEEQGFESFVFEEDGILHVVAGRERELEDALKMQRKLRDLGYRTMIISAML